MIPFYLTISIFLIGSAIFHFLDAKNAHKTLTSLQNIKLIGAFLIIFGIWGAIITTSFYSRIFVILLIISGTWRLLFTAHSIKFQSKIFPRWLHGILMLTAGLALLFLLVSKFKIYLN